ncbi:MAG: cytochrome c family protein [Sphingomonadaceae bacterium]|nr:cytochrome c family protein [Sphingomonadaceae bacterium]
MVPLMTGACSKSYEAADNGGTATAAALPAAVAANATDTLGGQKLADFKGDAAAGEAAFAVCKSCHVVDPDVNRIGPSLHAIVGRRAGTVPGFHYSQANKSSGITWTAEKLFQYLEQPQRVVPGTSMTFAGLPDPQKRADVIAYLKSKS